MGISARRSAQTDVMQVAYNLYEDLTAAGFDLVLHQDYTERPSPEYIATTPGAEEEFPLADKTGLYLLKATPRFDPTVKDSGWSILIRCDYYYINFWVLTEACYELDDLIGELVLKSVQEDYQDPEVLKNLEEGDRYQYGSMTPNTVFNPDRIDGSFFNAKEGLSRWSALSDKGDELSHDIDLHDNPISYQLTVTPQGVAFAMWAEGHDDSGDSFSWFVIQRPLPRDGVYKPNEGYNPLFCLFSLSGGGGDLDVEQTLEVEGIQQFVVRERDIVIPSLPTTAVLPGTRTQALINPLEQVSHTENSGVQMNLIEGACTWRYYSDAVFDLIGYSSADVTSQNSFRHLDIFGDGKLRKYEAFQANRKNNKGMRIFLMTGSDESELPALLNLDIRAKYVYYSYSTLEQTAKCMEYEVFDQATGVKVTADRNISLDSILVDGTAIEGVDYGLTLQSPLLIPKGSKGVGGYFSILKLPPAGQTKEFYIDVTSSANGVIVTGNRVTVKIQGAAPDPNRLLVGVNLIGPDTVAEGNTIQLQFALEYSNGDLELTAFDDPRVDKLGSALIGIVGQADVEWDLIAGTFKLISVVTDGRSQEIKVSADIDGIAMTGSKFITLTKV